MDYSAWTVDGWTPGGWTVGGWTDGGWTSGGWADGGWTTFSKIHYLYCAVYIFLHFIILQMGYKVAFVKYENSY